MPTAQYLGGGGKRVAESLWLAGLHRAFKVTLGYIMAHRTQSLSKTNSHHPSMELVRVLEKGDSCMPNK